MNDARDKVFLIGLKRTDLSVRRTTRCFWFELLKSTKGAEATCRLPYAVKYVANRIMCSYDAWTFRSTASFLTFSSSRFVYCDI